MSGLPESTHYSVICDLRTSFHPIQLCLIISGSILDMVEVVIVLGNCLKLSPHLSYIIFSWPHTATDLPLLISGGVEKKREQKATSGKILTN